VLAARPILCASEDATVPASVTYGPLAAPGEGDPDSFQIIYISLPADQSGPVYLRLFDADTGGTFDTAFGRFGDTTLGEGSAVSHSSGRSGRYPVRVPLRDSVAEEM
jgi:hypothetical protein